MATGERTSEDLQARRDQLARDLARADAICRRGEREGAHRPAWDDRWIALLREYEAIEDALARAREGAYRAFAAAGAAAR